MQRNLGLVFDSNLNPLVYCRQECSPIDDIVQQHEHMCAALSDVVGSLTRAVAVLLAAEMCKERSGCPAFAPV